MIASDFLVNAKLCLLCYNGAKKNVCPVSAVCLLGHVRNTVTTNAYEVYFFCRRFGNGTSERVNKATINDGDMLSHDVFGLAGARRKHLFSPYRQLSPSLSPPKNFNYCKTANRALGGKRKEKKSI